jgi:cytochrome P450
MPVTPPSVNDIDLSMLEFWAVSEEEREATFATLRRERPVARFAEYAFADMPAGAGYWAVTRFDDIRHVSRHPQQFISGQGINIGDMPQEISEFFGSMIAMDDPRHARIRGIVNRAFTPKTVNDLGDTVRSVARDVLAKVADKGECDFVQDVAAAVPLQIICDMMGIPAADYETIYHNTNIILGVGDPEFVNSMEDLINAGSALFQYAFALAEERRQNPRDDLTTRLVASEGLGDDEEPMTAQEYGSFFILLVVAGNETTRNAISWGMKLFTDRPEQRALLLEDFDGRIGGAVEEIVRYSTPVINFRRTATEDCVIAEQDIKAGDKVVLFYNSGNRDETKFDDPSRFDILRTPNDHLGFGAGGPHFCLGAHLARREIRVVFEELFRALPDIRITGEPDRLQSGFIHGIKRMPAAFTPQRAL